MLSFLGVDWPPDTAEQQPAPQPRQDIGFACNGEHREECSRRFGRGLALACSSCGTEYEASRS
ncbi:hypothetical protein LWC08_09090 [Desulfobaculum bizertense]|uniref:hypothetical protein n=1 Tax=Desulfobaculum bizertense TaxID=376490 RepID=UPI001F18C5F9|nr:hypothetical protein [Desulfobaculum bizertense]UIJ36894.1 hypothetical protein LWC08_09090 [Desulfobaculum bizertense]